MTNTVTNSRTGLKDIWNACMCAGANWDEHDIPVCPTILTGLPTKIITWTEAKSIYKRRMKIDKNFKEDSFVCFYEDDYKFDGTRIGIWASPKHAIAILSHFRGIISPDFSTYQDFPEPLKLYNTFRMRAFGYWAGKNNLEVINNVRWGTEESYGYCFSGIESNSVVCIGTVGGSPKKKVDRSRFEKGLDALIKNLSPETILVYGSANYSCFARLKEMGINIYNYPSATSNAFKKKGNNHE